MTNACVKTLAPILLVLSVLCAAFGQENPVRLAIKRTTLTNSLIIEGVTGGRVKIEMSDSLGGLWTELTNFATRSDKVVLDIGGEAYQRYYRVILSEDWPSPNGFIWLAPGTFEMGSPVTEAGRGNDETQHTVVLTKGLLIADHEVTQEEYQKVMGTNPAFFKNDTSCPVEQVSWSGAVKYCQTLTEIESKSGRIPPHYAYRLPTEAEWEYAARSGTLNSQSGALELSAWYSENSQRKTHPIKTKKPNALGLYDMLGNVSEWCADSYAEYPNGMATNPIGPTTGFQRTIRGSSWIGMANLARPATRSYASEDSKHYTIGFRTVLSHIEIPTIVQQPQNKWLHVGQTIDLSVTAFCRTYSSDLQYQWEFEGHPIIGATSSRLNIDRANFNHTGTYRVVIKNFGGVVKSDEAIVAVNVPGPLDYVWIPPGSYIMGSPLDEDGRGGNETQHRVTLSEGFWMANHEVTQAEYQAIAGFNPSRYQCCGKGGSDYAVNRVDWYAAGVYCQMLTEKSRVEGSIGAQQIYRLPTESEWEYAARAGSTGARYGTLDDIINSGPVKQKAPNFWGLYDMIGGVDEWCSDWLGDYPTGDLIDPIGPLSGTYRVSRGGNYRQSPASCRAAARSAGEPTWWTGFRPVLTKTLSSVKLPVVKSHPQALIVTSGQTAVLNVVATGTEPLRYQWQLNGVDIPGETSDTLAITNAQSLNTGNYRVIVANWGKVFSDLATLTVNLKAVAPLILMQPKEMSVRAGQIAELMVTVSGTEPITYQWLHEGAKITGATSANLLMTKARASDAGEYRVIVSNAAGNTTSNGAKLVVTPDPADPDGFVWISSGTFVMGSPIDEKYRNDDERQHKVFLTKGFWISDHEVTMYEYMDVMDTRNPSWTWGDSNLNRPVDTVSWNDAVSYCKRLTERERKVGRISADQAYRLPTEAEWEYAARAGSTGKLYGDTAAIASPPLLGRTSTVKSFAPNAWGIFDTIGNVWEWCADFYGDYPEGPVTDPLGPVLGSTHVARGHGWFENSRGYRFQGRRQYEAGTWDIGFRVVLSSIH